MVSQKTWRPLCLCKRKGNIVYCTVRQCPWWTVWKGQCPWQYVFNIKLIVYVTGLITSYVYVPRHPISAGSVDSLAAIFAVNLEWMESGSARMRNASNLQEGKYVILCVQLRQCSWQSVWPWPYPWLSVWLGQCSWQSVWPGPCPWLTVWLRQCSWQSV